MATARNKSRTKAQKFNEWWLAHGSVFRKNDEEAWMAGYLSGYRAHQYEGSLRDRLQRAKTRQ
jgi:hypothetical protein